MTNGAVNRAVTVTVGVALLATLGFGEAPPALAYEEVQVQNAGTLTGKAWLDGPIPEPRVFPVALYPFGPFCNKNERIADGKGNILVQEFEVGAEHGLKDVVVAVQRVKRGKPFPPIVAEIVSRDCEFIPFVSVVRNHGQFRMTNEDPVIHNAQLYQSEKGNLRLTVPNPPNSAGMFPIEFERKYRIYQMICGMHEFMQTWGYAVDNPYYALTDENGAFTIDGLPPGTYTVTAWRPHFPPMERRVTIASSGTERIEFSFDAALVKRPLYETQERFRIQR
ncbi:MAG: carboxypeptidase-like regulatory domain-containing protein [Nitrospirota bacterium]